MSTRVRFAPSPTGYLHIGGLRTALYNYLFAKKQKGVFILRIEDTDNKRKVKGAVKKLINALEWLGIKYDEGPGKNTKHGPYYQSKRLEIYNEYIIKLIQEGKAYPCFYNKKRQEEINNNNIPSNIITEYDKQFRETNISESIKRMQKENHVVRLKVPDHGSIQYKDLARGKLTFDLSLIEDQILIKSDGYPTYHFANVVDDHLMKISHVIRGEEWIPSMPKHLLLYQLFNWECPKFIHLPLILNKDKSKLSKRQNDVSVDDYIEKGYIKEAMINYLSLLGWHNSGNREIYSISELISEFSTIRIQKSGAVFDIQKLNWMNNYYIKQLDIKTLSKISKEHIPLEWNVNEKMLKLISGGVNKLSDIKKEISIFFEYKVEENAQEIIKDKTTLEVIKKLHKHIKNLTEWNKVIFNGIIEKIQNETQLKGKALWMPIRISLTGRMHGPDIGSIIEILGKTECKKRIKNTINE